MKMIWFGLLSTLSLLHHVSGKFSKNYEHLIPKNVHKLLISIIYFDNIQKYVRQFYIE